MWKMLMFGSLIDENKGVPRARQGFTLMELAIVFGVMGTILSAIWWAAGNVKETQRDNDAVQELQSVTQGINDLMAGQTLPALPVACNATGNPINSLTITCAVIAAQAIPNSYVSITNTAQANTPWSTNNFQVYEMAPKTFRVSFYSTTFK
jgi:type II secretory pathway pseudopilin PulG